MTIATLAQIETALSSGNLWAGMRNGNWWRLRRNGATQTWKRDASRFSIPVKAGLKSCARITETDCVYIVTDAISQANADRNGAAFIISDKKPIG